RRNPDSRSACTASGARRRAGAPPRASLAPGAGRGRGSRRLGGTAGGSDRALRGGPGLPGCRAVLLDEVAHLRVDDLAPAAAAEDAVVARTRHLDVLLARL